MSGEASGGGRHEDGGAHAGPPVAERAIVERFVADPGQIIALAQEAACQPELGSDALTQRMRRGVGRLASASWTALGAELDALLVRPEASAVLRCLERWGMLAALLPEVAGMVDLHLTAPAPHKDLWSHTLEVLEKTPPDADLRWVALHHDIGKVATRALSADGRICFHRHEALGARLFLGVGARLGLGAQRTQRIARVIEHHGRVNQFEPTWTDRALVRLMREAGAELDLMVAFSAADWTTQRSRVATRIRRNLEVFRERLGALRAREAASAVRLPALPVGAAQALQEALKREPGPWLKVALAGIRAAQAAGEVPIEADAAAVATYWAAKVAGEEHGGDEDRAGAREVAS